MAERIPMSEGTDPDNQDRGTEGEGAQSTDADRPELERRARLQGWAPKDQWRGDPDKWRDADEFLDYADSVNPILRENNRHLEGQIADLQRQLKEQQDQMDALDEVAEDMAKRAAAEARKQLAADLAEARRTGDTEAEAEILGKLAAPAASAKKPDPEPPRGPSPEAKRVQDEFVGAHPWFASNMKMAAYCNATLAEIVSTPEGRAMTVQQRLDKAAAETEEFFGEGSRRSATSSVGRSRPNPNRGNAKTWADIPAEDQAKAMAQGKRLIGQGKRYKDEAAWQKRYTELYFRSDWGSLQGSGHAA